MKLLAISDLHLANPVNREALAGLPHAPDDWLILAGDMAERLEHLRELFALTAERFAKVIWVPGNHELWTVSEKEGDSLAGAAKYQALVDLAREFGVVTPEDEYPLWTGPGGPCVVAPLFLLYDYSFRPDDLPRDQVIAWAREGGAVCAVPEVSSTAMEPGWSGWAATKASMAVTKAASEVFMSAAPRP